MAWYDIESEDQYNKRMADEWAARMKASILARQAAAAGGTQPSSTPPPQATPAGSLSQAQVAAWQGAIRARQMTSGQALGDINTAASAVNAYGPQLAAETPMQQYMRQQGAPTGQATPGMEQMLQQAQGYTPTSQTALNAPPSLGSTLIGKPLSAMQTAMRPADVAWETIIGAARRGSAVTGIGDELGPFLNDPIGYLRSLSPRDAIDFASALRKARLPDNPKDILQQAQEEQQTGGALWSPAAAHKSYEEWQPATGIKTIVEFLNPAYFVGPAEVAKGVKVLGPTVEALVLLAKNPAKMRAAAEAIAASRVGEAVGAVAKGERGGGAPFDWLHAVVREADKAKLVDTLKDPQQAGVFRQSFRAAVIAARKSGTISDQTMREGIIAIDQFFRKGGTKSLIRDSKLRNFVEQAYEDALTKPYQEAPGEAAVQAGMRRAEQGYKGTQPEGVTPETLWKNSSEAERGTWAEAAGLDRALGKSENFSVLFPDEQEAVRLQMGIGAKDELGRKAEIALTRAQQGAIIEEMRQGSTGMATQYAMRGAMRGPMSRKGILPLTMSDETLDSAAQYIHKHPSLRGYESANAVDALTEMRAGHIPEPRDLEFLATVYPQVVGEWLQMNAKAISPAFWEQALSFINLPRALMTSMDLSAPLRQGAWLLASHPKEGIPAIGPMIKSFFSDKYAVKLDEMLRSGEKGLYAAEHKVELPIWQPGGRLSEREENMMTRLGASSSPIAFPLRASSRSYTNYLNKLRVDTFWTLGKAAERAGNGDRLESIARYINWASGRGPLPKDWAPALNGLFFSARFQTGRLATPTLLLPKFMGGDPLVRAQVARDMALFFGANAAALTLADLAGLPAQLDPRSSDFGKIRIGNTRIDLGGGYTPTMRYIAQVIKGQRKTTGAGRLQSIPRGETALNAITGKFSPPWQVMRDLFAGKTMMGKKFLPEATLSNVGNEFWQRLAPMFIQDVVDAWRKGGYVQTAVGVPLGMFGGGIQSYRPSPWTQSTEDIEAVLQKEMPGRTWSGKTPKEGGTALDPNERDAFMRAHPELAAQQETARQGFEPDKASAYSANQEYFPKIEEVAQNTTWPEKGGITKKDFLAKYEALWDERGDKFPDIDYPAGSPERKLINDYFAISPTDPKYATVGEAYDARAAWLAEQTPEDQQLLKTYFNNNLEDMKAAGMTKSYELLSEYRDMQEKWSAYYALPRWSINGVAIDPANPAHSEMLTGLQRCDGVNTPYCKALFNRVQELPYRKRWSDKAKKVGLWQKMNEWK